MPAEEAAAKARAKARTKEIKRIMTRISLNSRCAAEAETFVSSTTTKIRPATTRVACCMCANGVSMRTR
eukprot:2265984-Karenia_brevis.AAC.1